MIKSNIKNNSSGYTLVETIFYIALFAVLSLVVVNAIIIMTKSFRQTTINSELMQGGNIMERISREIKQSYGIDSASTSTYLKLNSKDILGNNKTVEFLLSGSNIELLENGVLVGNLNTSNISATNLSFIQITTLKGRAVKIMLTIKSNKDSAGRTEDYYDTVVLRDVY